MDFEGYLNRALVLGILDTDAGGVAYESDGEEKKEGKITLRRMAIDCKSDHLKVLS